MRKRVKIMSGVGMLALTTGLVLLAGCGAKQPARQAGPPVVAVATIGTTSVPLTTELSGRTVATRVAEIRPRVNGIVLKRLFTEGADVAAGQVLYRLDPAPYRAALDAAQASLAQAQATVTAASLLKDRLADLLPSNAVSRQEFDDAVAGLQRAEAAVLAAKAQADLARLNLEYTDVTAPIAGRIGRSFVTEGAVVTAYQPLALAKIQQLDPIYVDVPQTTADLMRLQRHVADGSLQVGPAGGQEVQLIKEDGSVYAQPGTLQFRDVAVDPSTGSVTLRALFPNPDGELYPDLFVRCVVTEGVIPAAVLAPQPAVARDPKGGPYAWVVDAQGAAHIRRLEVDRAIGDQWLVTAGLAAGDRVVVEGLQYLRQDGTPVQVQ